MAAMIAAGDEKTFTKLVPRFARRKMVERMGLSVGTAEEFATFVAENTRRLANLFLKNFDAARPTAARNAVRYLQMTAVSWYLVRRTRPIRANAPNLEAYFQSSKRLRVRTVL
ncbi:MAG: hypothetical protein IIC95_10620, partial [Chloroflexi bacterium]|nr:hypothetical protein [Chloroflexota bacterium]